MIDLHVHSIFSDGSLTPAQLVDTAEREKLTAMGLTDHDSTDGIAPFLSACQGRKLKGIGGVEISVDYNPGTMHMLGYFVQPDNGPLREVLSLIRDGRDVRNREILGKLNSLGLNITWDQVKEKAVGGVMGRPHFAQALVDAGYVKAFKDAFDRYLAKGKPAYADRFRLTPQKGIELIRGAGGVAVLAHPATLRQSAADLRKLAGELREAGLQGVEVYYSEHSAGQVEQYSKLCKDYGLLMTGGSDFHGTINPDIKLGRGFGSLEVPDALLADLYHAAGVPP
jgi:hypothetical protein